MNIVFAVSNSYCDKLCVAITSVLENNKNQTVFFYILSSDFSQSSRAKINNLCALYENAKATFISPDDSLLVDLNLNIDYISKETYYRYIIADLLPKENKALYLDADIIVNGCLDELYNTEFNEYSLVGVRDLFIERKDYKKEIGFNKDDLYVNAGVLLFDLDKLRKGNYSKILIEKTKELENKISYQDQDIINIVFKNKIKEIDSIYNFAGANVKRETEKFSNAIIIHYTGKNKPWHKKCKNKLKNIWIKYSKKYDTLTKPSKKCSFIEYITDKKGHSLYLFGKKIFHIGLGTNVLFKNLKKDIDGFCGLMHATLEPKDIKPAKGILRDVQLSALKILKEIDRVCKEHKLTYWIDFGTLLGAVRHEGFIPWDDDIDICMVRDDYERFVEIFNTNTIDNKLKADLYMGYLGEVIIKVFHIDAPDLVFVDIFPADFCYKKMDDKEKLCFSNWIKEKQLELCSSKNKHKNISEQKNNFIKLRNENINNLEHNSDIKPSIFYGLEFRHVTHPFCCFDYDTIFPLKNIKFEGYEFPTVNDYDIYLTMIFGYYMTLPKRLHNHNDFSKVDIEKLLIIKRYARD